MDILELAEWKELLQELVELNPAKYRAMRLALVDVVRAERKLASPDLRVMLDILRTRFTTSGAA